MSAAASPDQLAMELIRQRPFARTSGLVGESWLDRHRRRWPAVAPYLGWLTRQRPRPSGRQPKLRPLVVEFEAVRAATAPTLVAANRSDLASLVFSASGRARRRCD